MKRLLILLVASASLIIFISAATVSPFYYKNTRLGFSITLPGMQEKDIIVEETETCVNFFHAPSYNRYGGLIGSIEVVTPRSNFFVGHYDNMAYQIIAMGENQVYLWKAVSGGIETSREMLDSFRRVSSSFSIGNLRDCLAPACPGDWPALQPTRHLTYLPTDSCLVRPDEPLTRGELAEMLYVLLNGNNKDENYPTPFPDVTGKNFSRAVGYLASYGILSGYADGTFRPNAPISRAAFAVLLHRCQFTSPVGRYGKEILFSDVPTSYWAEKYIYSAGILGWMNGSPEGLFHPMREITRAEAVTAINRVLGRDESKTTALLSPSPYADLDETHWAYANILEATGVLADCPPVGNSLPEEASVYYFVNETTGWVMDGAQLCFTADGGENWELRGKLFPFVISDLFFFDNQRGILLGKSKESNCILFGTTDGGRSWDNLLENPSILEACFPAKHFPTGRVLIDSIVSSELRPASRSAVYLTIRYHPYESIYVYDFEAVWQATITSAQLLT